MRSSAVAGGQRPDEAEQPADHAGEARNPGSKRERWGWLALFVLALVLRLVVAVQYGAHHPHADRPVIDEASYERWGLAIAGGDWLGDEVFFQEPLYPYWIGLVYSFFGHDRFALRVLQCALGALTCVLVGLLGRQLFGISAGVIAGLGLALYRPALLFPSLLLKPNLFLPLLAALALLLARRMQRRSTAVGEGFEWWGVGVLSGLGALLRGNMLILLPLFVLWPLAASQRRTRGLALACLVLLGSMCVLAPVAVRNRVVGGEFVLTTSGAGTNLYGGNNPENPYGLATEFAWVRGIPEYEADDWRREAERRTGKDLSPAQVSSYWMGELWSSCKRSPAMHAAFLRNKLRLSLGAYEVPDNHHLAWDSRYLPLLALPWPGFGVWGVLGMAGLITFVLRRPWRGTASMPTRAAARAAVGLALLFSAYLATIVLTVTSMRARLPLVPLLMPFAGYYVAELLARLRAVPRNGSPRSIAPLLIGLAVGAAAVHVPVFPDTIEERDLSERDYNLAVQHLEQGRPADAGAIADRLVTRHPKTARFQILMAEADFREGMRRLDGPEREGGQAKIESALERLRPLAGTESVNAREQFRVRRLAGTIQLSLRNGKAAANHLRKALEFDAEDPELRAMLVEALVIGARQAKEESVRSGLLDEATTHLDQLERLSGDLDLDALRSAIAALRGS